MADPLHLALVTKGLSNDLYYRNGSVGVVAPGFDRAYRGRTYPRFARDCADCVYIQSDHGAP
jgi:hypothetical protein